MEVDLAAPLRCRRHAKDGCENHPLRAAGKGLDSTPHKATFETTLPRSSMAERWPVKPLVAGSNPAEVANCFTP